MLRLAIALCAWGAFSSPSLAGDCDFIITMDERSLRACFDDLKSKIFILQLQLQTEQSVNRLARSNICLLALAMHTAEANDIIEVACAELKDAAAKKAKGPKGGGKPLVPNKDK